MKIVKNAVVTLNYQVNDSYGNVIDAGDEPLEYLHGGYDGVFPALQKQLEGKTAGEQLSVHLEPADAFGEYDNSLVLIEDRQLFPERLDLGMQFERQTESGKDAAFYSVTDIGECAVVMDGNHPLAGTALDFICTVAKVRAATNEEMAAHHVFSARTHHAR